MSDPSQLQERMGYQFREPELLKFALLHRSMRSQRLTTATEFVKNGRRSWVGDALLLIVVTEELLRRFPSATSGQLNGWRSILTSNKTLAKLAREIGLEEALVVGPSVVAIASKRDLYQMRATAMEAVIGAVFEDGGWESVRAVILHLLEPLMAAVTSGRTGMTMPP